ncbi:MAG: hypothetical protein ABL957_14545 [Parvularculaceae bacterium]
MTRNYVLALLNGTAAALCFAALPISAAQAATGARVLLQGFNPLAPDDANVVTLVDQPTLVSDSLMEAWTEARPKICDKIKGELGVGGAAGGETLYDITCLIGEPAALDIAGAEQTLRGAYAVTGYIEATSTTPTAFGSYADPRFSVAFTAKLALIIAVQPNRDQTLKVSSALFTIGGATLDSHNVSADVLEFVSDDLIPFFGGPNFKRIAENAVNSLSIDLASRFNTALAPVNAQLKGPSDAVRVGVYANPAYISVAFGPREIAPPTNGGMSGLLRWDAAQFAPKNGCQSFDIRATVQTGPVPLLTANAEAPKRQIGVFQASPAGPASCAFTMTGLAAGWPNFLTASVIGGAAARSAGSSLYGVSYSLAGDGWDGRKVIPQPVASERHYAVARSIDATAAKTSDYSSAKAVVGKRTLPRINPADDYAIATDGTRKGDTVTLNPQPLPPRQRSIDGVQMKGADAGIIIVSGKNADPLASKLPAADRVFGAGVDPAVAGSVGVRSQSAAPVDIDAMAAKGAALVNADPLAAELRSQQADDSARRGFDIGMAVAEGHTSPGPGKDAIGRSLPAAEQPGFTAAVDFSVASNRKKLTDLAPRGEAVALQDPLSVALRDQQADDSARLGFDIGMAVAEGQTAQGPGKDAMRLKLKAEEQGGFASAVTFSVDRNKNRERAGKGAAIAAADPIVGLLRNSETDVFYRLGFDIAIAIYGDPALGAEGKTATGPGSLGVRDSLTAAGQRGFDAAGKLRLGANYKR